MLHRAGNLNLVALALWLAVASCASKDSDDEWSRPYEGWLPGAAPEGIVATLVIDGEAGAAVPSARVLNHEESIHPLVTEPPLLAEATTDTFGLAWLDMRRQEGVHWTVDAPDHAAAHSYGYDPQDVYQVWPGRRIVRRQALEKLVGGVRRGSLSSGSVNWHSASMLASASQ